MSPVVNKKIVDNALGVGFKQNLSELTSPSKLVYNKPRCHTCDRVNFSSQAMEPIRPLVDLYSLTNLAQAHALHMDLL